MWYLRHHARRIIRNTMKPMDPEYAQKWLLRMRIAYVGFGIAAFGIAYHSYQTNKDVLEPIKNLDPTDGHRHMRLKGESGKVQIYRLKIGEKPEYFAYDNAEYMEDYKRREAQLMAELKAKTEAKDKKVDSESL